MIDMLDCTVQYLNNDTPVMILESDVQHARWERTSGVRVNGSLAGCG